MSEALPGNWSRVKLALPDLDTVRAGDNLKFWVYNGGPDRILIGEKQQLWYDADGVAELVYPGAEESIGYIIEPGRSHEFKVRLPNPLRAGKYAILHTAEPAGLPRNEDGGPLQLRATFELSAVSE